MKNREQHSTTPDTAYPVEKPDAVWRAELTPEQFRVLREHGTERPGTSPLNAEKRPGQFLCAACQTRLFDSTTKFESHSGWPSFHMALEGGVGTTEDRSLGMRRVEVHCSGCGGHLGHVFPDGPAPTGLRYCMNGAAMQFEPKPETAGRANLLEQTEGIATDEDDLLQELRGLLAGETDRIANAANTAALIFRRLKQLNWAGFYFLQGDVLVLGPFQGLPACTRIPLGRGVCGAAAAHGITIVVPDVHAFDGHIACDSASQSEIVVPFEIGGRLAGVLDIDSPEADRFSPADQALIEALAHAYALSCEV